MGSFMVFLEIDGEMRKIFHMARRVVEGFADVPNEDVDGHFKGHRELILTGDGWEEPTDSSIAGEEIDVDPTKWAWSCFSGLFLWHRQNRIKWRSVILSRLQNQAHPGKDWRLTTLKASDEPMQANSFWSKVSKSLRADIYESGPGTVDVVYSIYLGINTVSSILDQPKPSNNFHSYTLSGHDLS